MSNNRKHRTKKPARQRREERPRPLLAKHLSRVFSDILSQCRPLGEFDPQACDKREMILQHAFEQLRLGTATPTDIGELVDATNLAGFRIDNGADFQEAKITIWAAKTALESLAEHHLKTGRYTARAAELSSLSAFIPIYATMMRASTAKEWHLARAKLIAAYQHQQRQQATETTPA